MGDPSDIPPQGASSEQFRRWHEGALERRASALEEWDQRNRRIWRQGLLQIILIEWSAVLLMLWSFTTTSETAGRLAFWSALGFGDGGFLYVFVRTWRAAEGGAGT